MRIAQLFSMAVVLFLVTSMRTANAAEICGNGIDDDADGLADEGCDSNAVMGVCPSPMSCDLTGDVGPVSGAWVYQLPPDIAPAVAWGPKLQFQRTYMSMYSPSATNYRTAMGTRWQHNFQSWLDKSGTSVVVHLTNGQDVKFTFSTTSGGFDYYTPQAGAHFTHLRQATTSPNNWELKTLTGETYKYNWSSPVGKLIEIWDTLPTPNKIVIAYLTTGSNKEQIDTITDATGKKRFKFSYSSGRVSSVAYQTVSGSTGTTRVTLAFTYTTTNPTTVQLGGTTIQTNNYTSNFLTSIVDGAGKKIVATNFVTATPGKVANITIPGGSIGYDYASTDAQCSGKTVVFSNVADSSSCDATHPCTSGLRCGGQTGAALGGRCYRAARCLTTSSPSEDLVTTIAPFTPCTGSCAPVTQYSWNTSTLDLKGVKMADNNWTSFQRNSNGLVTLMAEGDTDDDPTNASSGAKTWLFYGASNFPGRLTDVRRRSDVQAEFTCDDTSAAGCRQTLFGWNNTTGLLDSTTSNGWSYDASNTLQPFSATTSYAYDNGRLSQSDGPLSGSNDVTQFTFWTSTDVLKDGYVNLIKRKKDATIFLTTTLDDYDYFGNAKSTQDPDGTFTCRTWDANRNYLSQVREAMATVQASCATTDPGDLITSYSRDTALRLTKTTRPVGDCEIQEYDTTWGRLTNTKLRDDCNAASIGDTRTKYYDANGYNEKTEFLNASSTVTRRMIRATLDGSQLGSMTNPVTPAYARTFSYFADAKLQTLTFENGLGRTDSLWDSQNRQTTNRRYTDAPGSFLDWVLAYPQSGATSSNEFSVVTDPASKATTTNYDDLGRKNRVVSPDTGTSLYVYDAGSRLVTEVIGYSSGAPRTNTFTYDNLGRRLSEDYDDLLDNCTRTGSITEVTYGYDSSPVTCPGSALCTRQTGRLAYVKSELLCDSTKADFTLDQETFMAYDEAGRLIQEYLRDDSGTRTADQRYAWDKNGNLKEVTAPSQAAMTYTLGGAGNSDANRIVTVARTVSGTPTNLLTGITWAPFGPVTQYDQANTIGGNALRGTFTWNLAYRAAQIKYAATGAQQTTIDFTEDEKGRYTQKAYSNVDPSIQNTNLQYDFLDRPTCDAAVTGSCPTSGTNLRSNVSYNSSNDRNSFYHQHSSYGGTNQYTLTYVAGSDKLASFTQSGGVAGTTTVGFTVYGQRASEDNDNSSADRRDYFYDHRMRVRTITGNFFGSAGQIFSYTVTYAYDHKNRLVYRSYATSSTASQTYYYYDLNDRLIEVKNIPNSADSSTYSIYNFYWLDQRPVAMWAIDFPAQTVGRYFMHTDESNRVLEVYNWPTSGDATRVWAVNPDEFGWDVTVVTGLGYQPLRLNNAILDDQIRAPKSFDAFNHITTFDRPGLLISKGAVFDPLLATSLLPLDAWPDETYERRRHDATASLSNAGVSQLSLGTPCFKTGLLAVDAVVAHSCSCAVSEVYENVPIRTVVTPSVQPDPTPGDLQDVQNSATNANGTLGDGYDPSPSDAPVIGADPASGAPLTTVFVIVECGQECVDGACAESPCRINSPFVSPKIPYPGTPPGTPRVKRTPCSEMNGCGGGGGNVCTNPAICGTPQ